MNDDNSRAIEAETEVKRSPGRPKGYPKTGGRPKGSKNRLPTELRQFIDARGKPLEFLAAIARGAKVSAADPENPTRKIRIYPSLAERTIAARALADRLLPVLKATEVSGISGNSMNVTISSGDAGLLYGDGLDQRRQQQVNDLHTARAIAFQLTAGLEAEKELEAAGLGHLIGDEGRALLGDEAEGDPAAPVIEDAVEVLPIGTEVDEGGFTSRLVERLSDGRERWECRSPGNVLLGTAFDRESLSARIRATQGGG